MITRENDHIIHEVSDDGIHTLIFLSNGSQAVNELVLAVLEMYDRGSKTQTTRILADTTRISSVPVGMALSALRRTIPSYKNPPLMKVALVHHSEPIATFINGFVRVFVPHTTTFRIFTPANRDKALEWLRESTRKTSEMRAILADKPTSE